MVVPFSTVTGLRDLDQYLKPSEDPNYHVEFDDDDAYAARENRGNALVGYFIGLTAAFSAIKTSLERAWRIKDLEIVSMLEGFFLFKFDSHEAGQNVLDVLGVGLWFVHGHPSILECWSEDISMYRHDLETIPTWVRFPNLNFCFRCKSALSKISSVVGNPICIDQATAAGTRNASVWVCIEFGIIRIFVWKPNPCEQWCTFNHGDKACP